MAEIDRLTLHNAASRLAAYLLDQIPSTSRGRRDVNIDFPKQVIASRLSITPETLSRTFARLVSDGLIESKDHSVTLKDIERLRSFASHEN